MEPIIYEKEDRLSSTLERYSLLLMNHITNCKWGTGRISAYEFEKIIGLPRLLSQSLVRLYGMNLFTFFINLCNQPHKLCFDLFDFDEDGMISKDDCHLILSSLPCLDAQHDEFIEKKVHDILSKVFTKKRNHLNYATFSRLDEAHDLVASLVEFLHCNLQLDKKLFFLTGEMISLPDRPLPKEFSFLHKCHPELFQTDGGQNLSFLDTNEKEGQRPWDMEGLMYEEKKPGMFSKYYYCLTDNHLYAFKKKEAKEPKFLLHLGGVYYKKAKDEENKMLGFELVRDNKVRRLYVLHQEEAQRWEKAIKIATGQYEDFSKDYKLLEKLGQGRSGMVWKAQCLRTKKIHAVKLIERSKAKKALYEKDMLKTLKHPGIVKLFEVYQNEDYFRIVEEIGSKGTLRDYIINQEYIDQQYSRQIVRQLAYALCYLKRKGVLHRDIKPENVVITEHFKGEVPRVKFVDFGLCTCLGIGETSQEQCGTLCFTAPEVLQGKPYSFQADVYSLGVLFYELLSRTVPYTGSDPKSILQSMKKNLKYSEEDGFECLSGDTECLLKKMLEKNPKKRIHMEQVYAKLSTKRRKFSSL